MYEDNGILTLKDLEGASSEELDLLRYRIQTDLFFLANSVLRNAKSKPLLEKVHGGICDALVHKFPTSAFGYAGKVPGAIKPIEEWSEIKERVILSSRGTLKSTIEAADVVQFVLCEPNIRMLLISGKLGLAKTILRQARGYFESNEVLMHIFPQFCTGIDINANEFTTPARLGVNYRDPTLQISSFDSVKAGIHVEVIKLDDCTNETNQATPELVEKSIQQYDELNPLLEPGGYIDFTGTRWAVDDLPEYIKRNGEEMEAETGVKHVQYFFQPIWTVKKVEDPNLQASQIAKLQEERDIREKKHQLNPEEVTLLWPEKLTAQYLWPKYRKNPRQFASQYLLSPESVTSGAFTHQLLVKQTRGIEECPLPHQSTVFANWDLAGISGKGDFAVGVVGIWEHTGRLFIIDAIVEKFTSSTSICQAILRLFAKYYPDYHRIEAANGAELLSGELTSLAKTMKLQAAFFPGFDDPSNQKDAKAMRIRLLAGALERNQLQFFRGIPCLSEIFSQFENFTGKDKAKIHDDAPDCIAQMWTKWKDAIGPRAINFLTPSESVVDFQSDGPNLRDKKFGDDEQVDTHADEKLYADIDFLSQFTAPSGGQ